jgi:hypothetical protein
VTTGSGEIGRADEAWRAVRADEAIQYAPIRLPDRPPAKLPDWLIALFDWLGQSLAPLGRLLGMSWPTFRWVLVGLGAVLLAILLWRLLAPAFAWRPRAAPAEADDWAPPREQALALLEEADRLAADGRYDEAARLLLHRSVAQIAAARPEWVEPSSTARELAALPALPDAARAAFATIAHCVERSLFALCRLGAEDWQAARAAYADFALERLPGAPA